MHTKEEIVVHTYASESGGEYEVHEIRRYELLRMSNPDDDQWVPHPPVLRLKDGTPIRYIGDAEAELPGVGIIKRKAS